MSQTKPVLLALDPIPDAVQSRLAAAFAVRHARTERERAGLPAALAGKVEAVTAYATRINAALLERLPRLRIVASAGDGAIDRAAAERRGVIVTLGTDRRAEEEAERAIGLAVAAARNILGGDSYVRAGAWPVKGHFPLAISATGKTLGLLSLGPLGHAIAARAPAFGMRIAYGGAKSPDAPWPHHPDSAALATASDFLVLAEGGGPRLDARTLAALRPRSVLVCLVPAGAGDLDLLAEMLRSDRLGGAAIRLGPDRGAEAVRLAAVPRLIVQPPLADETAADARARAMAETLLAFFAGKPAFADAQ